ncbi:hypothetical protein BDW72DRAFT_210802 [Aspergillus terricola var. indicus]
MNYRVTLIAITGPLYSLPRGPNYNLIITHLNLADANNIMEMAQILRLQRQISQIDVAVANTGICDHHGCLVEMADHGLQIHLEVNTFGPLRLFRALFPFLQAKLASLTRLEQNKASLTNAYGMSKVAGNYMIHRLHFEHEDLITFAVDPGFIQTDMGNRGARAKGLELATLTVDESVDGTTHQTNQATKSTTSGQFLNYRGEHLLW